MILAGASISEVGVNLPLDSAADLGERPVEHWLCGICPQAGPCRALSLRVQAGEQIRVEGRAGDKGEDRPGGGLDRDDGAPHTLHRGRRGSLGLRVDRQENAATLDGASGDQVGQVLQGEPGVRAGQHVVLRTLDATAPVDQRVVARHLGVERTVRIRTNVAKAAAA